jgi:hypothetical protein
VYGTLLNTDRKLRTRERKRKKDDEHTISF